MPSQKRYRGKRGRYHLTAAERREVECIFFGTVFDQPAVESFLSSIPIIISDAYSEKPPSPEQYKVAISEVAALATQLQSLLSAPHVAGGLVLMQAANVKYRHKNDSWFVETEPTADEISEAMGGINSAIDWLRRGALEAVERIDKGSVSFADRAAERKKLLIFITKRWILAFGERPKIWCSSNRSGEKVSPFIKVAQWCLMKAERLDSSAERVAALCKYHKIGDFAKKFELAQNSQRV